MSGLFIKLDANYPDDPRVLELSLAASGLHVQAMCLAKRVLKDGAVTRAQLRRLAANEAEPDALIDELVEAGLLYALHDSPRVDSTGTPTRNPRDSYRIAGWLDWNPSAESVAQTRQKSAKMNHERWHVGRGKTVPTCPFCAPNAQRAPQTSTEGLHKDSTKESVKEHRGIPETETETETKDSSDAGFAAWYENYPRHEKRADAAKAYRQALRQRGVTPELLTQALERQKRFWRDEGTVRKYTPLPATWLRAGSWDDELVPANTAAINGTGGEGLLDTGHGPGVVRLDDEELEALGL